MTKNRLELFSDGVFAIVLTLLVLNLKVPAAHGLASLGEVTPGLLVHAGVFFIVGALWLVHHGGLARVDTVTTRGLMINLLTLFWVTLLPFAAENSANRPYEPLGASLMAFSCGGFLLSAIAARLSMHSAIDDNVQMRRWRTNRFKMGLALGLADLLCAGLSWIAPWTGYAASLLTVLILLLLPSPPEAEQKFRGATTE